MDTSPETFSTQPVQQKRVGTANSTTPRGVDSKLKPMPYAIDTQKTKKKSLKPISKSKEIKNQKEKVLDREIENQVTYILNEAGDYMEQNDSPYQENDEDLNEDDEDEDLQKGESTSKQIEQLNQQLKEQEELHMPPDLRAKHLEEEVFKFKIPGIPLVEAKIEHLALLKLAHGPVHVEVIKSLIDLAQTYILTNACESSIPHLEKSMKLCYALLQKNPDEYSNICESLTVQILQTLALCHIKLNQLDKAESLLLKARKLNDDIQETEDDQSYFSIHLLLGQLYAASGNIDAAESSFSTSWEIKEQLGPDHPLLVTVYSELGRIYQDNNKLEQAADMFERAKEVTIINRGQNDMDVAHFSYLLCDLYSEIGDLEKALEAGRTAFDIVQKYAFTHDKLFTKAFTSWKLHVQIAYSCTLIHNQKYTDAAPLLHEIIEIDDSLYGDSYLSSSQKAFCLKMLGSVWAVLGAWHESHNCFYRSATLYAKVKGVNNEETKRLIHRLARIRLEISKQEDEGHLLS